MSASFRIGVDLGGTKIEAIALDADNRELVCRRVATPQGDYAGTLHALTDLVTGIERDIGATGLIGIGSPGTVSRHTGTMINCNSTVLNGKTLKADLEHALGRAIKLENDANCFALSEATDGAGAGFDMVFGVILGTGVGGGLVIDGKLRSGRHHIAGEWGHNPLPWMNTDEFPGPQCWCGRQGCIEMFLKGEALRDLYHRFSGGFLSGPEIAVAADHGDAVAHQTLKAYQNRLARALAGIANVIDPDIIILGGGISNISALYDGLDEIVSAFAFSDRISTSIVPARHGDSSGVRGAAWLN